MTADLRARVKAAVDRARRERLAKANSGAGRCAGCNGYYEGKTPGCKTCWSRHRGPRKTFNRHGVANSYKNGCRCQPCREAHRVKNRERKRAKV